MSLCPQSFWTRFIYTFTLQNLLKSIYSSFAWKEERHIRSACQLTLPFIYEHIRTPGSVFFGPPLHSASEFWHLYVLPIGKSTWLIANTGHANLLSRRQHFEWHWDFYLVNWLINNVMHSYEHHLSQPVGEQTIDKRFVGQESSYLYY
jgi:hypothetical protein